MVQISSMAAASQSSPLYAGTKQGVALARVSSLGIFVVMPATEMRGAE